MDLLVSIIIPVYNREDTILRAVESVCNQTYSNIEIIVVDDASTDSTMEKLQLIKDKRVRYYRNNINMGPSIARNIGVNLARGYYIAFQDSDDEWYCDKLEKQIKKINEDEEFAMVYCPFLYYEENRGKQIPEVNSDKEILEGYIYKSLLNKNKVGTPAILIKKEIFNKVGGFDESLNAFEDWDLAINVSKKYKIGYIDEVLFDAYTSKNGVNSNHANVVNACISIIIKNIPFVEDRSIFQNLIVIAMESLIYCTDNYKKKFVPKIIRSEFEFELLKSSYEKKEVYKNKYNAMVWIIQNAEQYINRINKKISIYGCGLIGRELIKIIKKTGKELDCVIDQNKVKLDDINTINIDEFKINNDSGICFVTVLDKNSEIRVKLQDSFKGEIINIFELI
jgi:glycosyltransferase involved in cell wall biosynthesis